MGQPFLVPLGNEIGIGQLQADVFEVVRKAARVSPFTFSKMKALGRSSRTARIACGNMSLLSRRRGGVRPSRTAGRAVRPSPGQRSRPPSEIELPNVALVDRPVRDRVETTFLVLAKGVAGPAVPVHDGGRSEAGLADADPRPPAPTNSSTDLIIPGTPRSVPVISLGSFVWHSQISRTSHPTPPSRARLRSSRSLFVSNFGRQKSSFDFGSLASLHSGPGAGARSSRAQRSPSRPGKTSSAAGKVATVQPVAIPHAVREAAHQHLGLGVTALYARHPGTAFGGGERVHPAR